uniref:Uncharacterized protein n=1 Tax=Panagrolaimus sp. JU765 TaxID=591449 RepID=A0AC34QGV0_9BILA
MKSTYIKAFGQYAVHVIPLHSPANAIMTISLIPAYRNFLLKKLKFRSTSEVQFSSTNVELKSHFNQPRKSVSVSIIRKPSVTPGIA